MVTISEQRTKARMDCEAPIMLEDAHTGYHFPATVKNYSDKGMYFESDYALRPGRRVRINVVGAPFKSASNIQFAKVIWRRMLDQKSSFHPYGIGAKYC